jgi:Protein of unknown function (DUF3237)
MNAPTSTSVASQDTRASRSRAEIDTCLPSDAAGASKRAQVENPAKILRTRAGECVIGSGFEDYRASENKGIRFGPLDLLDKLKRGEAVDPALIYCRTVPKFETGSEKYRWLMEHIFIASAARHPDRVVIDVFQVL